MLNLLRVELRKLFTGKVFWITVLVYVITITATFIPLSYADNIVDIVPSDLMSAQDYETLKQDVNEIIDYRESLKSGENNFFEEFYTSSSGQFMVVMIFVTVFIFADFLSGTLQNTLLCGYSRRQLYLAKLVSSFAGGCVFCIISVMNVLLLGVFFYGMPLSGATLQTALNLMVTHCVALIGYVSVYTAFSFWFGNGWSMLASTVLLSALPGIPMLLGAMQGKDYSLIIASMPSLLSVSGVGTIISQDTMLALPHLWTTPFVVLSLTALAVLSVISTVVGMNVFNRKQL